MKVWKQFEKQVETGVMDHPTKIFDYNMLCQWMTERKPFSKKLVPGMSPSWDNTPRRGMKAMIFQGSTPERFKEYMKKQLVRAHEVYHQDMLFINAWNEWAEGAHLEPDEKYGLAYLEALKAAREETGI